MTIHIYVGVFVWLYVYILSTCVVKRNLFAQVYDLFVSFQIQKDLCYFHSKCTPHIFYLFFSHTKQYLLYNFQGSICVQFLLSEF